MIVTGSPMRPVDIGTFSDITPTAVVGIGWDQDGMLQVEFAGDLSPTEADAVRQRMSSRNGNEEVLRSQAVQALVDNRAFLALAAPTQAQTLAQVKALTRQMNGAIRMLLGQLDGTN